MTTGKEEPYAMYPAEWGVTAEPEPIPEASRPLSAMLASRVMVARLVSGEYDAR
jgi:hypothetical protein